MRKILFWGIGTTSVVVLCAIALVSCPGIDEEEQNPFVGVWRLVSLELRSEDGEVSYPLGRDAIGYIFYTDDGYMSVVLMAADRPTFATDDSLGGSDDERAGAYSTYFSYCGRYEIVENAVTHHIEACSFPNWTGTDKQRLFEFDGDRLILSSVPYLVDGKQQTAFVIWERF